jgi:predicted RNase H-like nuclease (RuvC/YqgF family)
MTDPGLSHQIGKVEGKVDALSDRIGAIEGSQREMRAQGTQEHTEVRQAVRDGVESIEQKLTTRLNKHSEEIDDLQESRAKGRGIVLLLLSGSTIAAAAAAVLGVAGVL